MIVGNTMKVVYRSQELADGYRCIARLLACKNTLE